MSYSQNIGCVDAKTMIEMNNLAVGYFPVGQPEIGVYPPFTIEPYPLREPQQEQDSGRNP